MTAAVLDPLGRATPDFSLPFGPRPLVFISLMIAIAVLCSWVYQVAVAQHRDLVTNLKDFIHFVRNEDN